MNRKKYGIVFGAAAIVLMMVSSATAVTMPQSNESSKPGTTTVGDTNYVEPGIHLSGFKQKLILRAALKTVDDPAIRLLLQEIIKKMNSGSVDSSDIEQIIRDNTLVVGTVTSGAVYADSNGMPSCIRGLLRLGIIGFYYAKCNIIGWTATNSGAHDLGIYVRINDDVYTYGHKGTAIGYCGSMSRTCHTLSGFIWYSFGLDGIAILIFIS